MSVSRHLQRLRGYVPYIIAFIIALNGFLNLVTGLSDIFQFQFYLNLDSVSDLLNVTPEMRFGGAISVILGVTLIALGKGLIDRRRQPWWWTVGVLALLVVYQLYTGMALRSPGISTGLIILLLFFRRDFNQPTTRRVWTYAEIVAGISVIFALAYGIVGSYLLRSEFNTIEGWADAVYFTVVTYSTLGYGDILPRTPNAKLFTITMVVIGLSSFVTALTVLVGPLIEQRMKGVFSAMSKFQKTVNHVVICGCSKVTDSIIDELQEHHIPGMYEPIQSTGQFDRLPDHILDLLVGQVPIDRRGIRELLVVRPDDRHRRACAGDGVERGLREELPLRRGGPASLGDVQEEYRGETGEQYADRENDPSLFRTHLYLRENPLVPPPEWQTSDVRRQTADGKALPLISAWMTANGRRQTSDVRRESSGR